MAKTEKSSKASKAKAAADGTGNARMDALAAALGQIEKTYGRGAVMKLGDDAIENV